MADTLPPLSPFGGTMPPSPSPEFEEARRIAAERAEFCRSLSPQERADLDAVAWRRFNGCPE